MSVFQMFAVWFGVGMAISLWFPMRNFRLMPALSWKMFFLAWPFYGLMGPFAYFKANPFQRTTAA